MKRFTEKLDLPPDPRAVLGVVADATDEQIRAAYLRRVKEFPPDRNPVEFERVRDAYELLRDRRQRIRHFLFAIDPQAPVESVVLDHDPNAKKFVGLGPWLAVLKEK
jgi:curved DNA-binding protein CbpA